MIVKEQPYVDENGAVHENLVKHYSDEGVYIRQVETGAEYSEAVDVIPCKYTYKETDKPIEETDEILKEGE